MAGLSKVKAFNDKDHQRDQESGSTSHQLPFIEKCQSDTECEYRGAEKTPVTTLNCARSLSLSPRYSKHDASGITGEAFCQNGDGGVHQDSIDAQNKQYVSAHDIDAVGKSTKQTSSKLKLRHSFQLRREKNLMESEDEDSDAQPTTKAKRKRKRAVKRVYANRAFASESQSSRSRCLTDGDHPLSSYDVCVLSDGFRTSGEVTPYHSCDERETDAGADDAENSVSLAPDPQAEVGTMHLKATATPQADDGYFLGHSESEKGDSMSATDSEMSDEVEFLPGIDEDQSVQERERQDELGTVQQNDRDQSGLSEPVDGPGEIQIAGGNDGYNYDTGVENTSMNLNYLPEEVGVSLKDVEVGPSEEPDLSKMKVQTEVATDYRAYQCGGVPSENSAENSVPLAPAEAGTMHLEAAATPQAHDGYFLGHSESEKGDSMSATDSEMSDGAELLPGIDEDQSVQGRKEQKELSTVQDNDRAQSGSSEAVDVPAEIKTAEENNGHEDDTSAENTSENLNSWPEGFAVLQEDFEMEPREEPDLSKMVNDKTAGPIPGGMESPIGYISDRSLDRVGDFHDVESLEKRLHFDSSEEGYARGHSKYLEFMLARRRAIRWKPQRRNTWFQGCMPREDFRRKASDEMTKSNDETEMIRNYKACKYVARHCSGSILSITKVQKNRLTSVSMKRQKCITDTWYPIKSDKPKKIRCRLDCSEFSRTEILLKEQRGQEKKERKGRKNFAHRYKIRRQHHQEIRVRSSHIKCRNQKACKPMKSRIAEKGGQRGVAGAERMTKKLGGGKKSISMQQGGGPLTCQPKNYRMDLLIFVIFGLGLHMARTGKFLLNFLAKYENIFRKRFNARNSLVKFMQNIKKMSKAKGNRLTKANSKALAFLIPRFTEKGSNRRPTPGQISHSLQKVGHKEVKKNEDDKVVITKAYIAEEPDIKQTQPPTGINYQDECNRRRSFNGCPALRAHAQDLARSGLYLTDYNIVKCHSCHMQHYVTELGDRSRWHFPNCFAYTRRTPASHRHQHELRDVVADCPGRVSDDIGDPPGQQSVYIPPGDVRNEIYRLSTFEQFPVTCPISRKSLAKSGFYFTGFFDRVKCFACGRTVERWEARDNPAELRWHKPDCPFPRGDPCGNIPINDLFNRLHSNPVTRQQQAQQQQEQVLTQTDPNTGAVIRTVRYPADLPERIRRTGGTFQIGPGNSVIIQSGPGSRPNPAIHIGNEAAPPPPRRWRMANVVSADHRRFLSNLYLNRELDRLTSYARWPAARPNVSPAALAKSGFFYLGDMDRTQCFSCGGVLRNWTLEDDAHEEHRTHFPSCAMVRGAEDRNVPVPEEPELPADRMDLYPCRYPANPHMRAEAARLDTFDHRWPAGRVGATPAAIAQAGFFFLGERDRVKCWYCNGGLQNWEYDDIPWNEHSKWFPNCQFLLQNKGQGFVHQHLAMSPHLARPIIAKQEGSRIDPAGGEVVRAPDIPPGGPSVRQPTPPPEIIDPQEEMRKKKERIENIMKTSDICKNVIAMGFSQDVVRQLLEERVDAGNEANPVDIYESASALLDDVMKKEEEIQREAEAEEAARNQASMMSSVPSAYSTNFSSLTSSLGPAPGSGKYNVSFYDEDEPMDDQELYGSMNGPASVASVASANSVTATKQVKQKDETSESLQEQLQKIEEERMCKICFSNTADMVFIPCSHMCCCMECTQAIRQCPVCRKKIEKAIKTYVK